jgi:hypothetical protein
MAPQGRIELLRLSMREAAAMADKADAEWNAINDAFKRKHEQEQARRKARRMTPKTELQMRAEKEASYPLSDAFAVQGWWRTQTMYYAAQLQAELAADQMLREN